MTGFLSSFSGSMRSVPAPAGPDQVNEKPSQHGEAESHDQAIGEQASPPGEETGEAVRGADRAASAAALAIADQILGLAAPTATVDHRSSLALRTSEGSLIQVRTTCTIGRMPGEPGLTVSDGRVSRSHALVRSTDGSLTVEDIGSSNGTFLVRAGLTVKVGAEPIELQFGDQLSTVGGLLLAEVVEDAG